MNKFLYALAVLGIFAGVHHYMNPSDEKDRIASGVCAHRASPQEIETALTDGKFVDNMGCIHPRDPAPPAAIAASPTLPDPNEGNLAIARKGFVTRVNRPARPLQELPVPPEQLFVRSDYVSGAHTNMPAYVTPDPRDGARHPAIIWIAGGDFASFGKFWEQGPPEADQSAAQFREAGVVMFVPSLRGSANNGSKPEYFLGEVDDILAAAEHLARMPYVDPQRIYLGGHSTGGTLALLVAESSNRFKAVFALGVMDSVILYQGPIIPFSLTEFPDQELRLRSPRFWLSGVETPTYLIEGEEKPGNIRALKTLCSDNHNAQIHCLPVPGLNHFSVIAPAARVIAAKLAIEVPGVPFELRAEDIR